MPRVCTICTHSDRGAMDARLAFGESFRKIAEHFSVSESALFRHKAGHMLPALALAQDAQNVAGADTLLAKLRGLEDDAHRIGAAAEKGGDLRTALAGVRELTRIIELLARLQGEIADGTTVNVLVAPQWIELRALVLTAVRPYPEARKAVAEALTHAHA